MEAFKVQADMELRRPRKGRTLGVGCRVSGVCFTDTDPDADGPIFNMNDWVQVGNAF